MKEVSLKVLKCQPQGITVPGVGDVNSLEGEATFLYDLTAVLCPSRTAFLPT